MEQCKVDRYNFHYIYYEEDDGSGPCGFDTDCDHELGNHESINQEHPDPCSGAEPRINHLLMAASSNIGASSMLPMVRENSWVGPIPDGTIIKVPIGTIASPIASPFAMRTKMDQVVHVIKGKESASGSLTLERGNCDKDRAVKLAEDRLVAVKAWLLIKKKYPHSRQWEGK